MPVMTPEDIAEAFRGFVSDEYYRKFVRALNTTGRAKGRLLAWQDSVWKQFTTAHVGVPESFESIADALCICPVHLIRMSMEPVPIRYGLRQFSSEEIRAREEMFPFANYMVSGPDWIEPETVRVVPVCRACRDAQNDWNAHKNDPFGLPKGKA